MIHVTGIDISRWQHPVNWAVMEAAKPAFLAHRATIAAGYVDPWFASSVLECANRGIPMTAYHVVRCDYTALSQTNNFITTVKAAGLKPSMPLVMDCELDNGKSAAVIAQIIYDCLRYCEDAFGHKPMIYSRKQWFEHCVGVRQWYSNYDWWIALYPPDWQYYDRIPEPPAPVDLERVKFHQVTAHGIGKPYGVASANIDIDWWMGDQASLDDYISLFTGVQPAPDFTDQEKLDALWEAHPELHIRS
jgi:lysozyme